MACPLCDHAHPRGSEQCPDSRVGQVVAGRYRLERLLGFGGMGAVYQALQLGLGRRVALKMLLDRSLKDADALERFRREATAIATIRHPGIVQVQDLGQDGDGSPFMVMERLEGESVADRLDAGPLEIGAAIRIAREALDALTVAHEHGLVHRDLKPSNLFLAQDGRGGEGVKVLDFGLAKVLDEERSITRTGWAMGSAPYMSPEQCRDSKRVDARTDVYGMGATLFEMLTGYLPVSGSSDVEVMLRAGAGEITRHVRWIRPEVPVALDEIVARALAVDPGDRFPTAREMSDALALAPSAPAPTRAVAVETMPVTLEGAPRPRPSKEERAVRTATAATVLTREVPTATATSAVSAATPTLPAPIATTRRRASGRPVAVWLGVVLLAALGVTGIVVAVSDQSPAPIVAPPHMPPPVVSSLRWPTPDRSPRPPPAPSIEVPSPPAPPLVPEPSPPVPRDGDASDTEVRAPAPPHPRRAADHGRGSAEEPVAREDPDEPDEPDEPDDDEAPAGRPPAPDATAGAGRGQSITPDPELMRRARAVFASLRSAIQACGVSELFTISVTARGSDGHVLHGNPSLTPEKNACVRRVLQGATFPPSPQPLYTVHLQYFP